MKLGLKRIYDQSWIHLIVEFQDDFQIEGGRLTDVKTGHSRKISRLKGAVELMVKLGIDMRCTVDSFEKFQEDFQVEGGRLTNGKKLGSDMRCTVDLFERLYSWIYPYGFQEDFQVEGGRLTDGKTGSDMRCTVDLFKRPKAD
ncbi:unnamed protein product [Lepeophtheirus salmonis]|uniref:(salmon louse) hypothetical protein n=1 Tax=Lepeophtheirus salmonis TaxID=72036 RepID=A0A7R8CI90_LEPSM|nr:unnamed protein product [Lepeophtheirus salmonis]CAF2793450.1 unnamed protein product [Lepeophtheirus salmonis]